MGWLKYESAYDLDDPRRTLEHREIIKSKKFLRKLYEEWYGYFVKELSTCPDGKVVEIGSGGGFLKEVIPDVVTSDVMPLDGCDLSFSAEAMPFADEELKAVVMIDVLHHIPQPELFLKEATRTLKKGGKIIMTEPANTLWGRFIYKTFHHEPFHPEGGWTIPSSGPMSGANGALPWIIFERDKEEYQKKFPQLKIKSIRYHTPMRYLLSGGVSRKSLLPSWMFGTASFGEWVGSPLCRFTGMFMTIVLEKI